MLRFANATFPKMTCHPERSGLVRKAKRPAESKDPLTACAAMDI